MNDKIFDFSMIGVQDKDDDGVQMKGSKVKFVKVNSDSLDGKWCVLLFMDNQASDLEIEEWQAFNAARKDFNGMNVKLLGVCTDSHIAVRNFMHNNYLQDIKFPIISDRDGDFSRSFGLLKIDKTKVGAEKFHAARAVAILNDKKEMVYLCLKNEKVASNPEEVMAIIKHMQTKPEADKPSEEIDEKKPEKDGDDKMDEKGGKDESGEEKKPDKDARNKKNLGDSLLTFMKSLMIFSSLSSPCGAFFMIWYAISRFCCVNIYIWDFDRSLLNKYLLMNLRMMCSLIKSSWYVWYSATSLDRSMRLYMTLLKLYAVLKSL